MSITTSASQDRTLRRRYGLAWAAFALASIFVTACGGGDDASGGADVGHVDASSGDQKCPGFTTAAACPAGCKRTIENGAGEIWCGRPCSTIDDCSEGHDCGVYGYCAPVCALNSECGGFQGCGSDNVCSLCQEGGPC